jgi:hypothetical protein
MASAGKRQERYATKALPLQDSEGIFEVHREPI